MSNRTRWEGETIPLGSGPRRSKCDDSIGRLRRGCGSPPNSAASNADRTPRGRRGRPTEGAEKVLADFWGQVLGSEGASGGRVDTVGVGRGVLSDEIEGPPHGPQRVDDGVSAVRREDRDASRGEGGSLDPPVFSDTNTSQGSERRAHHAKGAASTVMLRMLPDDRGGGGVADDHGRLEFDVVAPAHEEHEAAGLVLLSGRATRGRGAARGAKA